MLHHFELELNKNRSLGEFYLGMTREDFVIEFERKFTIKNSTYEKNREVENIFGEIGSPCASFNQQKLSEIAVNKAMNTKISVLHNEKNLIELDYTELFFHLLALSGNNIVYPTCILFDDVGIFLDRYYNIERNRLSIFNTPEFGYEGTSFILYDKPWFLEGIRPIGNLENFEIVIEKSN